MLARPTQKEIVGIRTVSANLENLYHVEELAVNVADNGDRGLDVHDIALLHQQLFRLGADGLDDRVGEELFAVEAGDALIEIDTG